MNELVLKILTFGARRPIVTLCIVLILSGISVVGALKVEVDTSYDRLISDHDPGWPAYQKVIGEFGSDSTTIVFVNDQKLFTEEKLVLLSDLADNLGKVAGVERTESLFTALSIRDHNGQLDVHPLMDVLPETQAEAEAARADALYSPLMRRNLISDDGRTMAITITSARKPSDPAFARNQYAEIEKLLDNVRPKVDRIFQVGPPRLNVEIQKGMIGDMSLLLPLSTAFLIATVFYFLRTWTASVVPLLTAGISILWTFGYMGWTGTPLTLLTALVPSLNIVIGSAEDTHLMAAYLRRIADQKVPDRREAIHYMARHIGVAIFLTAATTSVGFLTDALYDMPLVVDFGLTSGFALTANFVATVLLMPLLLLVVGPTSSKLPAVDEASSGFIAKCVMWVEAFGFRNQRKIFIAVGLLTAISAGFAMKVTVSNDPLSYFRESSALVQDAKALQRELAGMQVFYITLECDKQDCFREPEYLKQVRNLQELVKRRGAFDLSISLADHIAMVNREMHNGDDGQFRVPDTRDFIEQYLMFFSRKDIGRYVSADFHRVNIVVRHSVSDSGAFNREIAAFSADAKGLLSPDIRMQLSGENIMINAAADSLISNQADSLEWVIAVIFVLMALLYQSVTAGIISMIPNIIPTIICFGFMGLLGIPLNAGTASVAAVALGIAIDDTIHFFSRYLDECQHEPDPEVAVRNTLRSEAMPIVTTTIALTLGFSILMISDFTIVVQYGFLAALTMIIAMVTDMFLTPALVRNFRLVSAWDVAALKVHKSLVQSSPLFKNMSKNQIKKAILLGMVSKHSANDEIFSQGTKGTNLFVVLQGKIDITRTDSGHKRNIATLSEGDVFGEVGFVDFIERTATATAVTDVQLLALNSESTRRALRLHPFIAAKLNLNIGRILASRLASTLGST